MKGLTTSNGGSSRGRSTCSFCKSPDHQVSKCPHIAPIKKSLDKGIIPLKYMASVSPNDTSGDGGYWRQSDFWTSPLSTWYSRGENWGDLFKQTEKAYEKWSRAQARAKNKKSKGSVKRTCGYCGGDHTRRTCGLLASHKTKLAKANRNFRKWFYEHYVEAQGLSTGAIVDIQLHQEGGYNQPVKTETVRTLVTEINWDSINLFADFVPSEINWRTVNGYSGDGGVEKLQNIQTFVQSGAYLKIAKSTLENKGINCGRSGWRIQEQPFRAIPLPIGATRRSILDWESKQSYYNSASIQGVSIVSRAPQVLADDWIDGYSDEMSVIFKKFSQAQLEITGILDHIKAWADKD